MKDQFDVAVIGGGVVGALTARELKRHTLSVVVLEAAADVAAGASRANSGIVHAGFDAVPGTLKAEYNVMGNAVMEQTCRELGVPFSRCGSLVTARAGMGRCQSGFCQPSVFSELMREFGYTAAQVTKNGGSSNIIAGGEL